MNICMLGDMIHVTFDNNNNKHNNNEYLYFRWYDSRHFWWLEGSFWLLVQVRQVLPDFVGKCFFGFHVEGYVCKRVIDTHIIIFMDVL